MAWIPLSEFKVERFDGEGSFTLWKTRVKDILVQQGVDRALKGKEGKPEDMTVDDWEDVEAKCISTIQLCLSDDVLIRVMREDSAQGLWAKLEELYPNRSNMRRYSLQMRLIKLKIEEGGNLAEHVKAFKGILELLAEIGVTNKDENNAMYLLTSLPDSYNQLIDRFTDGKKTVTMDEVESLLLFHHELTRKWSDNKDNRDQRGRSNVGDSNGRRSESSNGGKGKQCYKCKEQGHIKRDCPTL